MFDSFPAAIDIFEIGTRQTADLGLFAALGNFGHGFKITL